MRILDAAAIRSAVPVPALLDAIEAAYRDVATGRDRSPVRTRVALDGGDLLLMPGLRTGGAGTTVKLVTVVGENAARGIPTVQAVVVWFDGETGTPLALIDGTELTAMRTGAASGVGTRLLARPDASVLALFGTGGQAAWQVRAVCAARPIRELRIYARTAAHREAFAARMAEELGPAVSVEPSASARDAVRDADVVCCATTADAPVFEADWIAPGTHVNGVGAFRLDMVEMPPELIGRADLVAVDSREAALEEAGDLVAAARRGLLDPGAWTELGSIASDWVLGRDPSAITVFKSVGLAIQDVAAAELVVTRLLTA